MSNITDSLKQLAIEKVIISNQNSDIETIQNEYVEPYQNIKYDILTDENEIKEKLIILLKSCSQQYILKFVADHKCENILSECSAIAGRLDLLQYLYDNKKFIDKDICSIIAKNGHVGCLKYVNSIGFELEMETILDSTESNNMECFLYIYNIQKLNDINEADYYGDDTYNFSSSAAAFGNLELLQFLIKNRKNHNYRDIFTESAKNGHLDCLKYINDYINNNLIHNYIINNKITDSANEYSDIESDASDNDYDDEMKYLYKKYHLYDSDTVKDTVLSGHFECFKYLIEIGCNFSTLDNLNLSSFNETVPMQTKKKILNYIFKIFYIYMDNLNCNHVYGCRNRYYCFYKLNKDKIQELAILDSEI